MASRAEEFLAEQASGMPHCPSTLRDPELTALWVPRGSRRRRTTCRCRARQRALSRSRRSRESTSISLNLNLVLVWEDEYHRISRYMQDQKLSDGPKNAINGMDLEPGQMPPATPPSTGKGCWHPGCSLM